MKAFIEGTVITCIFWLAAIMDGQLDSIEQIKELRQTFDMALLWAINEGVKYL